MIRWSQFYDALWEYDGFYLQMSISGNNNARSLSETPWPHHFIHGLLHFFYIPNVLTMINSTIILADTSNKETDINRNTKKKTQISSEEEKSPTLARVDILFWIPTGIFYRDAFSPLVLRKATRVNCATNYCCLQISGICIDNIVKLGKIHPSII